MIPLRTPGYGHDTCPVDLRVDEQPIAWLGVVPYLPVGTQAVVRWQMEEHANIGWGEVALLAGYPNQGNATLRYVGVVDQTNEWETYAPGVQCNATLTLNHAVVAGESLYIAFAQWCAPTITGTGHVIPSSTVVRLTGSAWSDPISAGYVGVLIGDRKPSQDMANGIPATFDAYRGTRPIAASVLILPPPSEALPP